MKIAPKLVELAAAEVGTQEVNGTNCGPRVDVYKAATWLNPKKGWPWCAAFICWLVREAMKSTGVKETAGFKRPQTAGAWDFINWSQEQDGTTNTKMFPKDKDIQPGDIVVFTFSHIGLATSTGSGGLVSTIEGNTDAQGSREGGGVWRKVRKTSQIKARIRFTI